MASEDSKGVERDVSVNGVIAVNRLAFASLLSVAHAAIGFIAEGETWPVFLQWLSATGELDLEPSLAETKVALENCHTYLKRAGYILTADGVCKK